MADKVSPSPNLAFPLALNSISEIQQWATSFVSSALGELRNHASRLNEMIAADGSETPSNPWPLNLYPKASLPAAASWTGHVVYVTDETGGATIAFSDGTNWRRVQDRIVVS